MASQGPTTTGDVIVIVSDDEKQVKKRYRHRKRKVFDPGIKALPPDPTGATMNQDTCCILPFYDLTRITYIYKVRKKHANWEGDT